LYISASLPERYGVFNDIRKDNFPFNQTFSKYVELIAQIGINHKMSIVEVIGYIEDGLMGDERLPDIPEGDEPVQFRFKTDSDIIEQFYKAQEMTNRQVTMLIIMMTLRLSNRYGTSLHRIYSRIEAVSGFSKQKKRAIHRADRHVQTEPVVEKPKPTVQIKKKKRVVPKEDVMKRVVHRADRHVQTEPVVEKPKPTVQIKKKKRAVPKEDVMNEEIDQEEDVVETEPEEETVQKDIAQDEVTQEELPPTDDLLARMERLANKGQQLLGKKDEHDDVVVETNPALGDFFHTD